MRHTLRTAFRELYSGTLIAASTTFILIVAFLAFAAPIIANDRPIVMKLKGEVLFPALREDARTRTLSREEIDARIGPGDWALWPLHRQSPDTNNLGERLMPPSLEHPLGTDQNGRDVLARIIHGGRISLAVGFVSMGIAVSIGILVGALAGWFGGRTDLVISRIIEVVICFPTFFLILTVMAFWPPSIWNIMIVIGITGWTGIARLVRGEVLKLKNDEFVLSARVTGTGNLVVLFRHVLPHALSPVIVAAAFDIAGAMLTESSLSFLGFGVQPPTSSWGQILGQSKTYARSAWWLVVFPGLVLFLSITSYNILGDRLRERADPRSARSRAARG